MKMFRFKCLTLVSVLFFGGLLLPAPAESDDLWAQFKPPPDSRFDWIQLDSGEWLKGVFKAMYNHEVEFDSEEMNLQTFDFDDVVRLRTCTRQRVLVQPEGKWLDTVVRQGLLEIENGQLFLRDGDSEVELERARVIAIANGRAIWWDKWSGSLAVGFNKRSGNTETMDRNITAILHRRTARSELDLEYLGNYSEDDGSKTSDNHRLSGTYSRIMAIRFYWQLLDAEYYRAPFSNIDGQYSLGSGVAYDFIRTGKTELKCYVGLGYQRQDAVSVEAGEDKTATSPFLAAGLYFDQEVTKRIDFLLNYDMRFLNEENGRYTHHFMSTVSVDLFNDFDIDFSMVWDRIESPQPDSDGDLPDKDDLQYIVSIAYDF